MTGSVEALGELTSAGLVVVSLDHASGIDAAAVADIHHECANCGAHLSRNGRLDQRMLV